MLGRLIGAIFLIAGTSIGAGMLALPVVISQGGYLSGMLLLLVSWFLMTYSAFLILEANMWLPAGSNIISMARATLGRTGQMVAWVMSLTLLYSLLAAYISGGSSIIDYLSKSISVDFFHEFDATIFTLILGAVVYVGIKSVDHVNRALIIIKLVLFILLILLLVKNIDLAKLYSQTPPAIIGAITVAMTSFGYAMLIPSLRVYLNNEIRLLRLAIFLGGLIPFILYVAWVSLVMAIVPLEGAHGLSELLKQDAAVTGVAHSLYFFLHNRYITSLTHTFSAICVVTSFLGVAVSLADFLADGLSLRKYVWHRLTIMLITFLPPLAILLIYPNLFILGLSYAGICCIVLLVLMPILMVWSGRYQSRLAKGYRVAGGKTGLLFALGLGVATLAMGIIHDFSLIG